MVRKEDAEEAVKDPNPTIDGRRANVNLAYMGAKNRTATLPRMIQKKTTTIKPSMYSDTFCDRSILLSLFFSFLVET